MNISSSSLFHFTPKFEYLQGIIDHGFKFRPCTEVLPLTGYSECIFDKLGVVKHTLRSFLVCFCDIPLSASKNHRDQYGQYAIAMTKEWGMASGVTPVRYVHAGSPDFAGDTYNKVVDLPHYLRRHDLDIFRVLSDVIMELGGEPPSEAEFQTLSDGIKRVMAGVNAEFLTLLSQLQTMLPLVRVYDGEWTDRMTGEITHRVFYNEREWRAFSRIEDSNLPFKFTDVRRLIVTSGEEKKLLAEQLVAASERLRISDPNEVWGKVMVADDFLPDL